MTLDNQRNTWIKLGLAVLLLALGAYVLAAAFSRKPVVASRMAPGFAGSSACLECHRPIAEQQKQSRHAQALHRTVEVEKMTVFPAPDWVPDPQLPISYRITSRGKDLGVEAQTANGVQWQPAEWAFGSGHQGMTFVGRTADNRWVESALSFYRRAGWDFTVGFLAHPPDERQKNATGESMSATDIYDCFHCHAVGVQQGPKGVDLSGIEQGVHCESCHGPAGAHVKAARAGHPSEGIKSLHGLKGKDVIALCADCHRSTMPEGLHPNDPVLARFAPVGLQQSRCFRESNGELSCVSCHDPHTNASSDLKTYNTVCSSCHTGQAPQKKACPVQPRGNCVSCHMPKQIIQRNSIFTDHWIRVVKQKLAAK